MNTKLKWTAALLTSLVFLGSTTDAYSLDPPAKKMVSAALEKSTAKKAYRFEKKTNWKGPMFIGISVNGSSNTGIFKQPHVVYSKFDGHKMGREVYWIDGFHCTREFGIAKGNDDWKIVLLEAAKAPDTILSFPFNLKDTKSFTVKVAKNTHRTYVVEPTPAVNQAIATKILTEEHGNALFDNDDFPEIDWKKSKCQWMVTLDPTTTTLLIQKIEQQIEIAHKGNVSLSSSNHSTTWNFTYDNGINVEIPAALSELLKTMRKN